ncbi:MAG: RodZ domain-containing protein [Deferribacterales bacterium]
MSKLGELLRKTREERGLSPDKVTEDIRLSADIIEQLEDGGFTELPSYNHAKNFVKNYARYLGLNIEEIQAMLAEECTKENFTHEPITVATEEPLEDIVKNDSVGISKFFLIGILFILIIAIGGYLIATSGSHKTKPTEEKTSEQVQPQTETPQTAEAEDNEFNTVDKKIVEETISSVNEEEPAPQSEDGVAADKALTGKDKDKTAPAADEKTADKKEEKAVVLPKGMKKAVLNFSDVCWVHMKSDTGEEMDFIADKSTHKDVIFKDYFVLDIGNAAVTSVSYNGRTIAGLGGYKQPAKGLKFEPNPENGSLKYSTLK